MRTLELLAIAGLGLLAAPQCTPYQQQSAAIGAVTGGAIGALAGNDGGDVIGGAAIGAAAGTGIAAMSENAARNAPPRGTPQPPRSSPTPAPRTYPLARRTANPNQVISPYEPYNVIDITGFNSGDLARDPTNGRIFRIP